MKISSLKINEEKAKVLSTYNDETPITQVDIKELPLPEKIKGKTAELYINPLTGELWYEYVDIPMSEIEILLSGKQSILEKENETMRRAQSDQDELIMQLMLGGI